MKYQTSISGKKKSIRNPPQQPPNSKRPGSPFRPLWIVLLAIPPCSLGAYLLGAPTATIAYLVGVSICTLVLFGFDKGAARAGKQRVPERAFYFLALIGGSLVILLGMKLFRHKTRDHRFQLFLFLVMAGQYAAFAMARRFDLIAAPF